MRRSRFDPNSNFVHKLSNFDSRYPLPFNGGSSVRAYSYTKISAGYSRESSKSQSITALHRPAVLCNRSGTCTIPSHRPFSICFIVTSVFRIVKSSIVILYSKAILPGTINMYTGLNRKSREYKLKNRQ